MELNNIVENIRKSQECFVLSWRNNVLLGGPFILDNHLAQLCLKLPKIESDNDDDDIYILWLRNENGRELINGIDVRIFSTNDELIHFLSEIQTKNIFLIIDQYFISNILSFLDDFSQIIYVYILTNDDEILSLDCKIPIRQITNNKSELFRSIEEDIDQYRKDYISISIFDLQNKEKSNHWYHLLINSLFDLTTCYQTSKSDFIEYCREHIQQNLLTEFETNYSPNDAIRWYTRDSFLYHLFNKALRTRDIDLIFKFRFFIIDFQHQLEQYHNEELIQFAYCVQKFSSIELNQLINSQNKYISINTYFSATMDRTLIERFTDDPSSVVFVINIENSIHQKRPVSINDKKYEIIFPISSTFLIESIEMINNQWCCNLKLSDNDNYELKKLPSTIQFADLLISTGDYEKAERYLQILIKDLPYPPIDDIYPARIFIQMGLLYYQKNEYDTALEYYNKALNYEQKLDHWDLAELYDKFGMIFSKMDRFDDAVKYLTQSLDLRRLNYDGYLSTYISLVVLYETKCKPKEALRVLKEGLHVMSNTTLKSQPEFVFIYTYLGHLCYQCEDYRSSMIYCKRALQLIELNWNHEILIPLCYIILCNTFIELYHRNNDRINQLYYTQEAFNTYKMFLPEISSILFIKMGTSFYVLQETSLALDCFLEGLKFIDDIVNRIIVFVNLAMIFIDQGDIEIALDYLNQSFELTKQSTIENHIQSQLNYEYSRIYYLKNDPEKSIFHAELALAFNKNRNYDLIFNIYAQLSKLCPEKEHLYIEKLLDILQDRSVPDNIQKLYRNYIGLYYKRQKNYFYALDQFRCLLNCHLSTNSHDLILTYSFLSEIYLKIEPKEINQILFYSNKCFDIYSHINNHDLISGTLFLLSYSIADYFITEGNKTKGLEYIEKAKQMLNQYQGNQHLGCRFYILGSAYQSIQYYTQSIFYYKKSLSYPLNDYNQYGRRYASLAEVYREIKAYRLSISTYKIALTFLHNSNEINSKYLALAYRSAAKGYFLMNNYDSAFIYSQQSIEYFLLCKPIDYNSLVLLYCFTAMSYWKSKPWNRKQPLEYLLLAIGFCRYDLTNDVLQKLYSDIGLFCMLNECYDKAVLYYNKSFEYCCMLPDEISLNYENLWLNYTFMGDWNRAYMIVKKSIEHQFNQNILNYNHICTSYVNMGNTYYRFGKFELALKSYRTAYYLLQALQTDTTHGMYGEIYNYIGLIYLKYGNITDALKYCLKSRDILSLEKNREFLPIDPYISLGMIECKLGNYFNSLNYFGQAWELIYNHNRLNNLAYKILYNHIGYGYYKLGQSELAMKFYLKSISLHNGYNHHPDLAQVHKNIGLIYEDNPRSYSLALSAYKRALELLPNVDHPDCILYRSTILRLEKKMKIRRKNRLKRMCQLL